MGEIVNDFSSKLSEKSKWIFKKKYLKRDDSGNIIETINERIKTISKEVASVEASYKKSTKEINNIKNNFYKIMFDLDFLPGGRILSNVGSDIPSFFNCYVLPLEDSMKGIYTTLLESSAIQKAGGGYGINFSTLRPRGSYVKKSKGVASGPLSFMKLFDRSIETINSGNRRGAAMDAFNINHPDILDIIYSKTKNVLHNCNISIAITDDFMKKYENDEFYQLKFNNKNITKEDLLEYAKNIESNTLGGSNVGEKPLPVSLKVSKDNKIINNYTKQEIGIIDDKGNAKLSARKIMKIIAEIAWKTGDPGVLFLDNINKDNPLISQGYITATNPCGEQPLLPYGACDLGSINLSNMIKDGEIDYERLERVVNYSVRFLDNIIDLNKGPLDIIEEKTKSRRRIGLGVMGWADMLMKLEIPYDSEEATFLAEKVMKFITNKAREYSVLLAEEKGVFPEFKKSDYVNKGKEYRVRNLTRTTIAPTGSISMVANVNGGIEPYFSNVFYKNIRGGDRLAFVNPILVEKLKDRGIYSDELIELIKKNNGSVQDIKTIPSELRRVFKTAQEIDYKSHLNMQVAFQRYTDNAVSKTINLPNKATVNDFLNIYIQSYKFGLKGVTAYRDGSLSIQVLENESINKKNNMFNIPKKVSDLLPSIKIKQRSPFGSIYLNVSYDPNTFDPLEIFAQVGKSGQDKHANLEAICRLCSLALRLNVEPKILLKQLRGIGGQSRVLSREGTIFSLADAVEKALKKYLLLKNQGLILKLANGKINDLKKLSEELNDDVRNGKKIVENDDYEETRIECPKCHEGYLIREEGCKHCSICDYNACG